MREGEGLGGFSLCRLPSSSCLSEKRGVASKEGGGVEMIGGSEKGKQTLIPVSSLASVLLT